MTRMVESGRTEGRIGDASSSSARSDGLDPTSAALSADRQRTVRWALIALAVSAAGVGLPAAFGPRLFYDKFPFLTEWVRLLPPFNEHLVRDVGSLYLGFAGLFAWAAMRPTRALVAPICAAWLFAQAVHFVFHATHLSGFRTADAIAQTVTLASFLVLPLVPLGALGVLARHSR